MLRSTSCNLLNRNERCSKVLRILITAVHYLISKSMYSTADVYENHYVTVCVIILDVDHPAKRPLHKKCPYLKLFWSVFPGIRTEYEEIRSISQMRENTDQINSEYGHFSRSRRLLKILCRFIFKWFDRNISLTSRFSLIFFYCRKIFVRNIEGLYSTS